MYCFHWKYYDISGKGGILPTLVAIIVVLSIVPLTQTELMYLWILLLSNYVPISACQCGKQCTLLESNVTLFLVSPPPQRGRKCSRTHKAPEPHRLSYAGCRSTRLYRPNYCGVCRDGRCCSPRRTRTASVTFACPDGERFNRSVMFIQSCKCSDECNHLNEAAMPPQRWLYGDTHKFID